MKNNATLVLKKDGRNYKQTKNKRNVRVKWGEKEIRIWIRQGVKESTNE